MAEPAQGVLLRLPFNCGIKGCCEAAVCALQSKTYPELKFNVCEPHYRAITGKDWPIRKEGR